LYETGAVGQQNRRGNIIDTRQAAYEDQDAVVELTRELVRIPSRGGLDPYEPVLDHMASWLGERGMPCARLAGPEGTSVALVCEVKGAHPGPRYVLDACLDTAPFGDESSWTYPPTSAEISGGWLHGRGTSDSKAGAAIFAHVAARLYASVPRLRGTVVLLFDVDEHTGRFGGAKAFFEGPNGRTKTDGVMIGYPGLANLVTGGRGILRADLRVYGVASHSGGSKVTPSAVAKAAVLVSELHAAKLPGPGGPEFPLTPRLTVTAINGGQGYSTVPDLCEVSVDVRLTPMLSHHTALDLVRSAAAAVDSGWSGTRPTTVQVTGHWPAFALPEDSALRGALLDAAAATGLRILPKIAGPSSIGNYLAGLGIPATAGFGVDYADLHGTDERIRIDSIPLVHAVYHQALLTLLNGSGSSLIHAAPGSATADHQQ
jgi:succinyl-diaminopimelate desuccinylase